jgi:hypothetical protein
MEVTIELTDLENSKNPDQSVLVDAVFDEMNRRWGEGDAILRLVSECRTEYDHNRECHVLRDVDTDFVVVVLAMDGDRVVEREKIYLDLKDPVNANFKRLVPFIYDYIDGRLNDLIS